MNSKPSTVWIVCVAATLLVAIAGSLAVASFGGRNVPGFLGSLAFTAGPAGGLLWLIAHRSLPRWRKVHQIVWIGILTLASIACYGVFDTNREFMEVLDIVLLAGAMFAASLVVGFVTVMLDGTIEPKTK